MIAKRLQVRHTRRCMAEIQPDHNGYENLIEESTLYFEESYPDYLGRRSSFDDTRTSPDFRAVFGVTRSKSFDVATVALNAYIEKPDSGLLIFAGSLKKKEKFITCLMNTIDPFHEYFDELRRVEEEPLRNLKLRLRAEQREFETKKDQRKFTDQIENICYPVPIDRSIPITAYLFTTNTHFENEPTVSVGSMVFATGAEFGDESGFPPYWSYAEVIDT